MIFRPATPGFVVTLVATLLLALVSFNTPIIKSIYFLKASLSISGVNGSITLGTLGYCLDLSTNGTTKTCSSPSVGYEFDVNSLVGNDSSVEIPSVVVKWITYALFLHVIALCGAALSALFGLLAHVREMSMACCSTCISGLAAAITLVAFIFDIVLFFVVKKRVEDVNSDASGSASFGSAVWMTLAAAILLFFSGCVYACGRCMIRRRPKGDGRFDNSWMGKFSGAGGGRAGDADAEQMRLDAVKAEAERKARQKNEVGLPAFPDRSEVLEPLKRQEDESDDEAGPYRDHHNAAGMGVGGVGGPRRQGSASTTGQTYRGGYAQAPPGTRAVDEYYAPTSPARSNSGANTGYPPNRQYSASPAASAYRSTTPGAAGVGAGAAALGGAAGVGAGAGAGYLAAGGTAYGHRTSDTSYHTAASSQHQQYPSAYSQYDPYSQTQSQVRQASYDQAQPAPFPGAYGSSTSPPPRQPSQPYADPYSSTTGAAQPSSSPYVNYGTAYGGDPFNAQANVVGTSAGAGTSAQNNNNNTYGGYAAAGGTAYRSPTSAAQNLPERSYTLGGGGYGGNVVPDSSTGGYAGGTSGTRYGVQALSTSPPPMPTADVSSGVGALNSTSAYGAKQGARQGSTGAGHAGSGSSSYEDAPPGYEASGGPSGPSVQVPAWGSKAGLH